MFLTSVGMVFVRQCGHGGTELGCAGVFVAHPLHLCLFNRLLIITGWRVNIVQAMRTILTHIKEVSLMRNNTS